MINQPPKDRNRYVNQTFSRVAIHYDLMNRLMTAGLDLQWRKEVIRLANLEKNSNILDLGTGTGDLARAALRDTPGVDVTAADFTLEMMTQRNKWENIKRCAANALELPFDKNSFDVVISGFLMRNVTNVQKCLNEQIRVLKPGGKVVILDTTRPRKGLFSPFVNFHLRHVIPTLGSLITGDREAYTYLPESTRNFLKAEDLAAEMTAAGFSEVTFKIRMFGTVAIHQGRKII